MKVSLMFVIVALVNMLAGAGLMYLYMDKKVAELNDDVALGQQYLMQEMERKSKCTPSSTTSHRSYRWVKS